MQDQLRAILEAEAAARGQLQAAEQEASRLVQEAEGEGRARVQAANAQRGAIVQAEEERLVGEARAKILRLTENAKQRSAAMGARAEARTGRAVEEVLRCVLGPDDGDVW